MSRVDQELDRIDKKILNALQRNGRITMADLSQEVGLSATPCARRIKQMEDAGYISKYVALLDPAKLDAGLSVFTFVRLRSQTAEAVEVFEKAVMSIDEIVACYLVTGSSDYLVHARVKGIADFKDFVREKLISIASLAETQSSVVLQEIKATTEIPL